MKQGYPLQAGLAVRCEAASVAERLHFPSSIRFHPAAVVTGCNDVIGMVSANEDV